MSRGSSFHDPGDAAAANIFNFSLKIGDVCACSATTRDQIAKRVGEKDLAR